MQPLKSSRKNQLFLKLQLGHLRLEIWYFLKGFKFLRLIYLQKHFLYKKRLVDFSQDFSVESIFYKRKKLSEMYVSTKVKKFIILIRILVLEQMSIGRTELGTMLVSSVLFIVSFNEHMTYRCSNKKNKVI